MEIFDIEELRPFVTILAERFRMVVAQNVSPAIELSPTLPEVTATPNIRRDWTTATCNNASPDVTLSTSDSVTFQVHRDYLLATVTKDFTREPSPQRLEESNVEVNGTPALVLPYSSAVVNILLHIVYKKDGRLRVETPSLVVISTTLRALKEYGIPFNKSTSESTLLFSAMASHCQTSLMAALEVYALAASHAPDLHHVAVFASSFLHSLDLSRVTDETARVMGSIYYLRLTQLLLGRTQAFKRLLLPAPRMHKPSPQCNTRVLREAWTLMTSFLMWRAAPDIGDATIDELKDVVIDSIRCKQCNESFKRRFDALKRSWASVKRVIR
ncbi:hypothetical protein SCHPADRAFT_935007 [Schizopora paradoxa]|uniref:BTB domain-containing protein n=1 Tax=Schizopora paradoxa TaxID=27342 RepID=A0A0H2SDQ1_9AGAM|nr:hypothetical protein SCHPADRAFT_935007 [Schizopora paradoxa]